MRKPPAYLKTKNGAWLTPEGNPIAMRDCELIQIDPDTKEEKKQQCIFFSDDGDSKHKPLLPTFHDETDKTNTGGFRKIDENGKSQTFNSVYEYTHGADMSLLWEALWLKYTQNDKLRQKLLDTEDAILVYDIKDNSDNLYGRMLMLMRSKLQEIKKEDANAPSAQAVKWTDKTMPAAPTEEAINPHRTGIVENANKKNSIDDFTRLQTNNYDKMPPKDKEAFIKEIAEEAITNLNTAPKQHYQNKIEFSLATKKKKNPQTGLEEEEDPIKIQGDKISIDFEMTFGRKSANEGQKKETITLHRTSLNPEDGSASFSIQKKADTFEERKEIFKLMAETAAKIQMGGLDRKKEKGLLLTGAEERQLNSAKFTNLEVPDEGVLHDLEITIRGQVIPLERVTQKQAAAIAGFLEHFDTVNFKRKDGTILRIEAPPHLSMMSTEHGALPEVVRRRSDSSSTIETDEGSLSRSSFSSNSLD